MIITPAHLHSVFNSIIYFLSSSFHLSLSAFLPLFFTLSVTPSHLHPVFISFFYFLLHSISPSLLFSLSHSVTHSLLSSPCLYLLLILTLFFILSALLSFSLILFPSISLFFTLSLIPFLLNLIRTPSHFIAPTILHDTGALPACRCRQRGCPPERHSRLLLSIHDEQRFISPLGGDQ